MFKDKYFSTLLRAYDPKPRESGEQVLRQAFLEHFDLLVPGTDKAGTCF